MSVVFLWYLVTFPFVPSRPTSGADSNYLRMFNNASSHGCLVIMSAAGAPTR